MGITFLHAPFLYALIALAIPIIIHLLNFRKYKTVFFSDIRFLKDIKEKSRSRTNLKKWIILLFRMLAVAALIIAFARPILPADQSVSTEGQTTIGIIIDNSFSMNAEGSQGRLLDEAKNIADEIIKQFEDKVKYTLLTHQTLNKHQFLSDRDRMLEYIAEIEETPDVKKLSDLIHRQSQILTEQAGNKMVFVISDFQKNIADFDQFAKDSSTRYFLIPISSSEIPNVYIDSAWFESPHRQAHVQEELKVRVVNNSNQDFSDLPLYLKINGEQKAVSHISISPKNSSTQSLKYQLNKLGDQKVEIKIEDHPITYDDTYYLSYSIPEKIKVIEIYGGKGKSPIGNIFRNDSLMEFSMVRLNQLDYSILSDYDLIVLNEIDQLSSGLSAEIRSSTAKGSNVFLVPSVKTDIQSYNSLLSNLQLPTINQSELSKLEIGSINTESDFFKTVFNNYKPEDHQKQVLPYTNSFLSTKGRSSYSRENLLSLKDGRPYLEQFKMPGSYLYFLHSSIDTANTDFVRHGLIVPIIYRMALLSNQTTEIAYTLNQNQHISLPTRYVYSDQTQPVLISENQDEIIPSIIRSGINNYWKPQNVDAPGHYLLKIGNQESYTFSFNYNRLESDLNFVAPDQLEKALQSNELSSYSLKNASVSEIESTFKEIYLGEPLWKYFIWLALIFLLVESLLIRVMKV